MSASEESQASPVRVFISYSHDSREHCDQVLEFAQQLRRDGIDAKLDQFEELPAQGWPLWCARQILDAGYVLLICTKAYRARFLGLEAFGEGRGVKWEGKLIQNILYYDEVSTGFIPLIFTSSDELHIPETIREASWQLIAEPLPADAGYAQLRQRLTHGRKLAPLALPEPAADFRQRDDASVPTEEVWEASGQINAKLDKIRSEQKKHEEASARRHRTLKFCLIGLALLLVGGLVWNFLATQSVVTDPKILRVKLEEKIDDTFQRKLAHLKSSAANPADIDQLYRWREEVVARLDETVEFIQSTAGDQQSTLTRRAAAILQERGVDAALEHLEKALAEEGRRHKERSRELAQAALFKAELELTKLDYDGAQRAIKQAIDFDYQWWSPHNRIGKLLLERAQWNAAEKEFMEAQRFVEKEQDTATVLNNLALLLQATNRLGEAEPLMRRALQIAEKSYGPDHPSVAIDLDNLAQLLKDTNRLGEAEPLMRRTLLILLKFTRETGHFHPDLRVALENYSGLLKKMSLGDDEIRKRLVQVGIDAGFDLQSYGNLLGQIL